MDFRVILIALATIAVAVVITVVVIVRRRGDAHPAGEHITIEFYSDLAAGPTGEGTGWFAQIVEERFNMTVNYLGDGDAEEFFQARRAAGSLGDLVIISTHRLEDAISNGLLLDITGLVEGRMHYYTTYFAGGVERARQLSGTGRIYGLPVHVSTQPPGSPMISEMPPIGAFLRQDAYMAVGAPTIYNAGSLLPILADMQHIMPTADSGRRTYAFSLYRSPVDDNIIHAAAAFAAAYNGMVLFSNTGFIDFANRRFESFLDIEGMYLRTLKLYFDANQLGLLDPASAHQGRDAMTAGFEEGAVLFSWWQELGMQTFNTPEREARGVGYNFIPIMSQLILHGYGINPGGPNYPDLVIGVGAGAKYPERIIDFIDWLASPEGNQTVVAGPEGLTWEMVDYTPVPTEFGLLAGVHTGSFNDIEVPEEWGGGSFNQGAWPGATVVLNRYGREINPRTGLPFNPRLWPSAANVDVTRLQSDWTARFGSNTPLDFLLDNNMIITTPDFETPRDPQMLRITRNSIRRAVVEASWRMIFADSEAEFFSIWLEMNETVRDLGWNYLFEHDSAVVQGLF